MTDFEDIDSVKREAVCSFLKPHSPDYIHVDNEGYILLVTGDPAIDDHRPSPFQKKFVEGYVKKRGNMTAAARWAGSEAQNPSDTGKKTYEIPWVRHEIELTLARQVNKELMTPEDILNGIKNVIDAALADGKYKEALDGYKLLGVEQEMFNPVAKQQIQQTTVSITDSVDGDRFVQLKQMLDTQPKVLEHSDIVDQINITNANMDELEVIDVYEEDEE